MEHDPSKHVFRPKKSGYFVFFILLSPSIVLYGNAFIRNPHSQAWHGLLSALILLGLIYTWIAAFKIVISADRLVIHNLFGRKQMLFADVAKAEVAHKSFIGFSAPILRLYDSAAYSSKPLSIPIGVLPTEDVKVLGSILKGKKIQAIVVK